MNYNSYSFRQAEEIVNSKLTLFNEIRQIVSSLQLKPWAKKDHDKIKGAFKNKIWSTEEQISKVTGKKWRYDAYKDRIAIEIDTKTPCYRSFLKFILGYNLDKIDVGVIMVYDNTKIENPHDKRFTTTQKELKDLRTIIPVPILLMGIYP